MYIVRVISQKCLPPVTIAENCDFYGFPVVGEDKVLIGYVVREKLREALGRFIETTRCLLS